MKRGLTMLLTLIGEIVSSRAVFRTGSHNPSIILMALFLGWVSAPFFAVLLANSAGKRWSLAAAAVLVPISWLLYETDLLWPAGTKAAFPFLAGPLVCWLLIAVVVYFWKAASASLSARSRG